MNGFIEKIASFFTTVSLIFTYIFGFGTFGVSDGYELVKRDKLSPVSALYAGQGICYDGEFYYSSGSITAVNINCLAKWDGDLKRKVSNFGAIPDELHDKYGSNHIGGIDCANGYIYAPVEEDDYNYNFILLYDCETLEYTGKCYDMSSPMLTDGIPWCAADEENGFLYTSKYSGVTEILQYDLSDMSFIKAIPLSQTVNRIQGGSVYEGVLYLSADVSDSVNEEVFAVELSSGSVSLEMTRYMCNYDNEAEDLFIYPFDDGSLVHTIDYDKLIGINVMHYKKSA